MAGMSLQPWNLVQLDSADKQTVLVGTETKKKNICPGQDAWIEVDGGCAMQISMDEMMDPTE
jgi:hypothetical protein